MVILIAVCILTFAVLQSMLGTGFVIGAATTHVVDGGLQLQTIKQRFWEKVDIQGPDDCWEWLAGKNGEGYGAIGVDGKTRYATHVLFYLRHGYWPPQGRLACHHCDNRSCLNPRHLYLGTHKSNAQDRVQRDRCSNPSRKGEHNGRAKLTEKQVQEIRTDSYSLQKKLAEKYGVTGPIISRIKTGKLWRLPIDPE